VAPYEADAQLAYLFKTGRAHAVITEDSDLLIFGVTRVMFKMDKSGIGIEIDLDNLEKVEELNFRTFTPDMLLLACIISGCDYIDRISGIGFKKAHKLVYEHGDDIQAIVRKIRREGKHFIPKGYEETFEKALLTFKFQLVYCPEKQKLVHLHDPKTHPLGPLLDRYQDLHFLGHPIPDEIAQQVARGDIDPMSKEPYQFSKPVQRPEKTTSGWIQKKPVAE